MKTLQVRAELEAAEEQLNTEKLNI